MHEPYQLRLLGGFSVESTRHPSALTHGSRRLVAYLALHGPRPRDEVAGQLWPDATGEHALANLRTGIWRANRALPCALICDEHLLALSASVVVDSREQESIAGVLLRTRRSDVSWLRDQVHHLWSGDLLPGWYDDWVVHERERLRQLRLHSLERAAHIFLHENELELAVVLALEAVRAEPLRESANAVLIEVHLAQGNVVDAVRRYETFSDQLLSEFGCDPSPRMVRLIPDSARYRHAAGAALHQASTVSRVASE